MTDALSGAKRNYGTLHTAFLSQQVFCWGCEVLSMGESDFVRRCGCWRCGSGGHRGGPGGDRVLRGHAGRRALCPGRCGRLFRRAAARRRSFDAWLPARDTPFYPWLLLVIPTVGGLLSGVLVFTLRARGGRARHRRRDRRLPSPAGADPAARAAGQDHRQRDHARHRRLGRPRRADRPDRRRLRLVAGQSAAAAARRTPRADGGRHGRGHRRHLPRPAGRHDLRRRSALQLAGVRARSDHARRHRQRGLLLRLRRLFRLETAVQHPRSDLQQPLAAGALLAVGAVHGRAGHALHAHVLRHASGCFTGCRSRSISVRPSGRFSPAWSPWSCITRSAAATRRSSPCWPSAIPRSKTP